HSVIDPVRVRRDAELSHAGALGRSTAWRSGDRREHSAMSRRTYESRRCASGARSKRNEVMKFLRMYLSDQQVLIEGFLHPSHRSSGIWFAVKYYGAGPGLVYRFLPVLRVCRLAS